MPPRCASKWSRPPAAKQPLAAASCARAAPRAGRLRPTPHFGGHLRHCAPPSTPPRAVHRCCTLASGALLAMRCFHGARTPGAVVHQCRAAGVVVAGPKSKAGAITIPSPALAYLLRRLDGHVSTLHNVQSAHSSSRRSQVHAHLVESTVSTLRNRRVESTHNPVDSTHMQSSRRASSRRPSSSRLDSVGTNSRLDWRQLDWLWRRLDCTGPPDGRCVDSTQST